MTAGTYLSWASCSQRLPGRASKAAPGVRSHWQCWSLNKAPQGKQNVLKGLGGRGSQTLPCGSQGAPLASYTGTDPAPEAVPHSIGYPQSEHFWGLGEVGSSQLPPALEEAFRASQKHPKTQILQKQYTSLLFSRPQVTGGETEAQLHITHPLPPSPLSLPRWGTADTVNLSSPTHCTQCWAEVAW